MSENNIHGVNMAAFIRQKAHETPYKRAIVVPSGRDSSGRVAYTGLTFKQLEEETNPLHMALTAQVSNAALKPLL